MQLKVLATTPEGDLSAVRCLGYEKRLFDKLGYAPPDCDGLTKIGFRVMEVATVLSSDERTKVLKLLESNPFISGLDWWSEGGELLCTETTVHHLASIFLGGLETRWLRLRVAALGAEAWRQLVFQERMEQLTETIEREMGLPSGGLRELGELPLPPNAFFLQPQQRDHLVAARLYTQRALSLRQEGASRELIAPVLRAAMGAILAELGAVPTTPPTTIEA